MVSWAGDGLVAGYDSITKRLKAGLYHFATPGSVDLNGVTRIHYPLGAGLDPVAFPNSLQTTAPFTFTSGDFSANPGKVFSAALFITNASNFPEGHIPTPAEILALGDAYVDVYRATRYASSPQTITFDIPAWRNGRVPNTKFWLMVMPTALANPASTWNLANDQPVAGVAVNTISRALSMWGNRTPLAPTITSPADGSAALPGSLFNLTINPNDPDEMGTADTKQFNSDVAGVQFQYAPVATDANPTPAWNDIPFDINVPGVGPVRYGFCWYIRGSRYFNGLSGAPELIALIENLGLPIVAGAGHSVSDYQPGRGALPSGEWQLRARTFDFGCAYPSDGTSTAVPGPLGINLATTQYIEPARDHWPANNTSPWSTPVRISIPNQVPPPTLLSPIDDVAVPEDQTVTLSWQYRNTHQPPRAQFRRAVQIRKVGDTDWSTIFDGYTSDTTVVVPPVLTQTPIPDVTVTDDFEDGTLEGWTSVYTGADTSTLTNITSAPDARSGSHYLRVVAATPIDGAAISKTYTPPSDDYGQADVKVSIWNDATFVHAGLLQIYWKDGSGHIIIPDDIFNSPFVKIVELGALAVGWNDITVPTIYRPPTAAQLFVDIFTDGVGGTPPYTFRVDDISILWAGIDLDDFSLSETNEYEWRVQTADTDGVSGNYGTPARFWLVPSGGSGEVRPGVSGSIEGATLGCGTHRAYIYRRGGKTRVGEITNLSHVDWERKRDDISTAQLIVSGWDIDCGNLLSILEPWAYELVLFRSNGFSVDRVWEGPLTLITYETDKVTIDAKDVMGYVYRRIIKQKMTDSGAGHGTTVVDRARRVIQNVMAPDDPNVLAYLQVLARDDDAMQYRSTPAYSRTAFEEVDDMAANAGLDYTTVGRSIMVWGTKHRIGTLPEFGDDDLGASPIVSVYGMSFANRYVVSDGNGVWGEATRLDVSGNDETYGLVEMLSSTWASDSPNESGTYTAEGLQSVIHSFESFAERSIASRNPPPVVVRIPDGTSLNPTAVISIQHLVPGVVIPLRSTSTLRTVVASQKLDAVKVVEEAGTETVSITVSPFSRDDAAAVVEEG